MIGKLSISKLPSVYFDGCYRVLGCLPSDKTMFAKFFQVQSILPSSQWQEIDLQFYNIPVLDQNASSSCVGHAGAVITEYVRAQAGLPFTQLSPWFLYSQIDGGRDAGASISTALQSLQTVGISPDTDVPHGTILKQQITQQAYVDAKNYMAVNAYHCETFEEICTSITLGWPVSIGLYVGNNFSQVDSEGVAPLPNGGGGGHNVVGMGLKKSSRYGWLVKIQNSWGVRFAKQGFAYLQKASLQYMNPDAFTLQSVLSNSDNPPVVIN